MAKYHMSDISDILPERIRIGKNKRLTTRVLRMKETGKKTGRRITYASCVRCRC